MSLDAITRSPKGALDKPTKGCGGSPDFAADFFANSSADSSSDSLSDDSGKGRTSLSTDPAARFIFVSTCTYRPAGARQSSWREMRCRRQSLDSRPHTALTFLPSSRVTKKKVRQSFSVISIMALPSGYEAGAPSSSSNPSSLLEL